MNRKIIKAAAAVMAVMMAAGAVPAITYAFTASTASSSSESDEAMKTALTTVKKRVKVPTELTEFGFYKNTSYSMNCYTFTWSTPNTAEKYKSLSVSVCGDIIYSYNYSGNDNTDYDAPKLAALTDTQLAAKAKSALRQINPSVADKCEYTLNRISLYGNEATVSFQRYENGIIVDTNEGSISIDKNNGEIRSMQLSCWWTNANFTDAKKALSKSAAETSFEKLCTLTPKYAISMDWDTDTKTARLVYRPDYTDPINALTGKKSTFYDDMSADNGAMFPIDSGVYYDEADSEVAFDSAANGVTTYDVTFTPAELKEISADESLMSKDALTDIFRKDAFIKLSDAYRLDRATLSKDEKSGDYFYNMSYLGSSSDNNQGENPIIYSSNSNMGFYSNINAKTGKIENFYRYGESELDDLKAYPVKKGLETATAAAKHFYADIFGEYKGADSNSAVSESWEDSDGKKHFETERGFSFNRFVNNVEVEGDDISVSVNNLNKVNSVQYTYSDVKFPSAPRFDSSAAFKKLFTQQDMSLSYTGYYKKDGSIKVYLLYSTDNFTLDRSYSLCSYDGSAAYAEDNSTDYTDIKGIKQEKAITTLARYGITLSSTNGRFNPNGTLNETEYRKLINAVISRYSYSTHDNSSPEDKTITNAAAARIFTEQRYDSAVGKLTGIYKSPFSDVPDTDENAGYASIAYAAGFMKGTNGKLNPSHKLTRAEAMQLIYDYIVFIGK